MSEKVSNHWKIITSHRNDGSSSSRFVPTYVREEAIARDNNAEGIGFRKRFNQQETFGGGWRTSKSNPEKYFRNLEKNIFCSEINDFVVIFS